VLDHFLDRGYHHLGLCGFRRSPEGWLAQLHRQAEQRGIDCAYFGGGQGRLRDLSGAGDRPRLEAWLKALPRPAGVLAYNDLRGRHVLEAARRMGLGVPEQLAVVGVGDDELICESTDPPLSSVLTPAEAIGHAAAQMLHDKLAGRTPGPGEALPARRLVARASSDQVAIRDPVVAAAIRFIRAQAIRGADVNAVLAALPVSRTTLEQRFKKVLGRTPHAEVHRVRVERAKELLELTELSVQVVAQRSGFGNATRLAEAMRRAEAMTPSQFRTAARQR
jgi:LacI family transcriptional regulator